MRPFQHALASPVVFGAGSSSTIADKTFLKKHTRVAVITDAGVVKAGLLDAIVKPFHDRVCFVDDGVVPDADVQHVDNVAARAKEAGADAILAVGGGSVLDSAKGVAMALLKGVSVAQLEGIATVRGKTVPVVCVPTTAGTGSEATQFCVIKDRQAQKKRVTADVSLTPALAVLDPALVVGLPASVTCATAVDALTHAVEALASKMRNPIGTALALEAVRILVVDKALERSLKNPGDLDARGDCLVAANLAGQAVTTAMLGACHAFAHVVGASAGVPHGVANGLFLTAVMKHNQEKAKEPYQRLASALSAAPDDVIRVIEAFIHDVAGVPRKLRDVAPHLENELPRLAKEALLDPDIPTNPAALDEQQALTILRERW